MLNLPIWWKYEFAMFELSVDLNKIYELNQNLKCFAISNHECNDLYFFSSKTIMDRQNFIS